MSGVGHFPMLEAPAAFNAKLADILRNALDGDAADRLAP